jgi:pimeloyl-ACP methyl ester carboxylesterase
VNALTLIGIPLEPGDLTLPALPDPRGLRPQAPPTLFVAGGRDPFCPAERLRDYAEEAGADCLIVENTDHYFWRRERELAAAICDWTGRALGLE